MICFQISIFEPLETTLVLGGYYNSLKRTTPRIIAKRITTFFLSDGGKSVVFYDQAYSGLFEDEFIKPILQKILSEAKQLFSTLSVDYKIIQDYLKKWILLFKRG